MIGSVNYMELIKQTAVANRDETWHPPNRSHRNRVQPIRDGPHPRGLPGLREVMDNAARVAKAIHSTDDPNPSLDFAEDNLTFRLRWDPEKFRQGLIAMFGPRVLEEFGARIQSEMQLPVGVVLINKRIAFMTMPGEPFAEIGLEFRKRSPVQPAFLVELAHGSFGYIPTAKHYEWGGYETWLGSCAFEPHGSEKLLDTLLEMVAEIRDPK